MLCFLRLHFVLGGGARLKMNNSFKKSNLLLLLLVSALFFGTAAAVYAVPPQLLIIPVNESFSEANVNSYVDGVEKALKEGQLKHVLLEISSQDPPEDPAELLRLGTYLFKLRSHGVVTVSYILPGADPAAAGFLASATQEIAAAPGAKVGGFDRLDLSEAAETTLLSWASEFRRPDVLFRRMCNSDGDAYSAYVTTSIEKGEEQVFLTPGQFAALSEEDRESIVEGRGEKLCEKGGPLLLTTQQAKDYGIAQFVAQERTALLMRLGIIIEEEKIRELGSRGFSFSGEDGAHAVAEFLQRKYMRFLLITLGLVMLFLEFQVAGLGVPGMIGLLCFSAFFTSGFVTGYVTYFELGLFIASLVLIVLEILVIPGFGVAGITGAAALLTSLVLAMCKDPEGPGGYTWDMIGDSLFVTVLSLSVAVGAMAALAKFLPGNPFARHIGLLHSASISGHAMREEEAPAGQQQEQDEGGKKPTGVPWPVGETGVAETDLRPAGKMRIGERLLDVVSGTDYIDAGTDVVVVKKVGPKMVVIPTEENTNNGQ